MVLTSQFRKQRDKARGCVVGVYVGDWFSRAGGLVAAPFEGHGERGEWVADARERLRGWRFAVGLVGGSVEEWFVGTGMVWF